MNKLSQVMNDVYRKTAFPIHDKTIMYRKTAFPIHDKTIFLIIWKRINYERVEKI